MEEILAMPETPSEEEPLLRLARTITGLTYGDMRMIGEALYEMTREEGVWDLTQEYGWADLLHSWADGYIKGAEDQ